MKKRGLLYFFIALILSMGCKKPYQPPEIIANNDYLVIEGVINTGTNAVTTITLTRTRNLGDTVTVAHPELRAQVVIESDAGGTFNVLAQNNTNIYQSVPLNLSVSNKYRLKITTQNGSAYVSDFVVAKQSPPIDSVSWKQDKGIRFFVHTHDAQNKTIYYRWDFTETWQYRAAFEALLGVSNKKIFYRDSTNQVYNCWGTENSQNIITASTAVLGKDVVSYAPLNFMADSSEKAAVRYSINVRQYALTQEAYQYWEILKKNTQQTGTVFDPQPSQLPGNFKCLTNPNEPVLGFISATSISEKRIFISNNQLVNWVYIDQKNNVCVMEQVAQDPVDYLHITYSDTTYSPYYFITPGVLAIEKTYCLDCTRRGGSSVKPSFW